MQGTGGAGSILYASFPARAIGPALDLLGGGMSAFLFACPHTGHRVQGWTADDVSEPDAETFEQTACLACGGSHFVNPTTGKVLWVDQEY